MLIPVQTLCFPNLLSSRLLPFLLYLVLLIVLLCPKLDGVDSLHLFVERPLCYRAIG